MVCDMEGTRPLSSMSSEPMFDKNSRIWAEVIKKLRGVLGDDLKLQESKMYDSIDDSGIQNPRRNFRKKRSPRYDPLLVDSADDDDGPSTSEEISAAISLQLLRKDHMSFTPPQISWKEKNLVSAFPQNFTQDFSRKSIKKPIGTEDSKICSVSQRKRCRSEDIKGKTREVKKKVKRSLIPILENLSPELPMNFKSKIREITGTESEEVGLIFFCEKNLSWSDVNPAASRLLMPLKKLKNDFLTEEEKVILARKGSIEALLIQPSLDECKIKLKKWDMGGKSKGNFTENYVLVTTWNKVVEDNNMAQDMKVQLWSFRRGDELCFALVNRG